MTPLGAIATGPSPPTEGGGGGVGRGRGGGEEGAGRGCGGGGGAGGAARAGPAARSPGALLAALRYARPSPRPRLRQGDAAMNPPPCLALLALLAGPAA